MANRALEFGQQDSRQQFSEFLRLKNVLDRNCADSVSFNEASGRHYEAVRRRNMAHGLQAVLQF